MRAIVATLSRRLAFRRKHPALGDFLTSRKMGLPLAEPMKSEGSLSGQHIATAAISL